MILDKISDSFSAVGSTLKSMVKMALQSRRCMVSKVPENQRDIPCIVMGNGPSLADTIRDDFGSLTAFPSMAVNYAANAPEFRKLRPRYYILADPHFFGVGDGNVARLWDNLAKVDWPMTLFLPAGRTCPAKCDNVKVEHFNPVGVEGTKWIENFAYGTGRGMPRPRNVLIPAIMVAILMGYRNIYIVGADHSWMRTLSVNESNEVVSVQPHFYQEDGKEQERITAVYANVKLHEVVNSFYVAFRAYHRIEEYCSRHGIHVYNSTPGSMIDAFPRRPLPAVN